MLRVFNLIRSLNSMFVLMLKLLLLLNPLSQLSILKRATEYFIFLIFVSLPHHQKGRGFGVYARQKKKTKILLCNAHHFHQDGMGWHGVQASSVDS